jgi:transposase InsO family protein
MQGLAQFFVRYNEWRQHQALGYQTPATVYFQFVCIAVYLNSRSFLS